VSDPTNASRHLRHSQILVPKSADGITIVRPLTTLGYDDAPLGHAEVRFDNVRVPSASCCSAKVADSRSPKDALVRGGSIIACV
jgi:alkylation response protein AidB-like acyl-CoA dehydrogenase